MSSPAANHRGILAMLAAMIFFIGNDTLLKLAASTYPPGQIMAIRSGFASLMALGLVAGSGELGRLRSLGSPVVLEPASRRLSPSFTSPACPTSRWRTSRRSLKRPPSSSR